MANDSSVRKAKAFTDEAWMTVTQAAKQLGCAPQTVYVKVVAGELETTRVAGRIFVSRASVERALGQGA
jgi:excisionase family DNA binding protein